MRVGIGEEDALIEARKHGADRGGFRLATQIVAREIEKKPRADITFLAHCKFIAEADGRNARNGDRVHWQVSVSGNNFDTASDVHRIEWGLVHFDEHFLLGLIHNGAQRLYAGPIENAQAVKIAFGLQELAFA